MAKPTRFTQEMIDNYIVRGYWDQVSINDILEQNAIKYPDEEAVVDATSRYTWSQFNMSAHRIALRLLELGVKRDQAIVAQLPNSAMQLVFCMALQKAGIICCFVPMTFRFNEMEHILKTLDSIGVVTITKYRSFDYLKMIEQITRKLPGVKFVFVAGNNVPEKTMSINQMSLQPIEKCYPLNYLQTRSYGPFEVSNIGLSSGSTGMPKYIEHTGANYKVVGESTAECAKLTHNDIVGIIAPLSGGSGMQNWWAAFQLGAKVCLLEHFSPEDTLKLIQKEKITCLAAVPTQIFRILQETNLHQYDLSSLRLIRTGAAPFDAAIAKETEERMGCKVIIGGGSQETNSFALTCVDDPDEIRIQTLGKPFPKNELKIVGDDGIEVQIGEIGELWVRGAACSSGYYNDIDATIAAWGELGQNGWFRTGDIAKIDTKGHLSLVGRKKHMILRGGQNIFPNEIENTLRTHPKIQEVVVIGVSDPIMGERVCACVVPRKGFEPSLEELVLFLKGKGMSIYKLPERLEIISSLPLLADGQKIDKKQLVNMITEKIKRETRQRKNRV